MDYDEFTRLVQDSIGLESPQAAEHLVSATLSTLGERIYRTEQSSIAAQLPAELRQMLAERSQPETTRRHTERYDIEEFFTRVSARAGVNLQAARRQTRAVMAAMRSALSPGAYEQLQASLPADFQELFSSESP
jgi:uncharacterized protein (DUF2267 family)